MRISVAEDEDFPGQFSLWQANCRRSLKGMCGQAFLLELEAALVALPEKELIAEELEADGLVCAFGALKQFRGEDITDADREAARYDMEGVGESLGAPRLVAWRIVYENDINTRDRFVKVAGPSRYNGGRPGELIFIPETPAGRYERVLAWVRWQIAVPA